MRTNIKKSEIPLLESNGLATDSFRSYSNPHKYQLDNYDFFKLTDTVVDEKNQSRYLLRSTRPKYEKRKRLWRNIYIVDTSKPFKPLLYHPTAYEIWKSRNNFTDGLITHINHYNQKGVLDFSEKLTKVSPLTFSIKLNEN